MGYEGRAWNETYVLRRSCNITSSSRFNCSIPSSIGFTKKCIFATCPGQQKNTGEVLAEETLSVDVPTTSVCRRGTQHRLQSVIWSTRSHTEVRATQKLKFVGLVLYDSSDSNLPLLIGRGEPRAMHTLRLSCALW